MVKFRNIGLSTAFITALFSQNISADDYDFQLTFKSGNFLVDRYEECGGRKVEDRIVSYQNGRFGIDLEADNDSYIRIRWLGNNANTNDGVSFLSCNKERTRRWTQKREKKALQREKRRNSFNHTLPRPVVFLPQETDHVIDLSDTFYGLNYLTSITSTASEKDLNKPSNKAILDFE